MTISTVHPTSVQLTVAIMKKAELQKKMSNQDKNMIEYNITSTIWYVQAS